MGVNFSAILKHGMDFKAMERFQADLNEGTKFPRVVHCLREVSVHHPRLDREWSLTRDRNIESTNFGPFDSVHIEEEEYVELEGPGGFSFLFNAHICEFSPLIRWHSFLVNQELQTELRAICQEFANYFGYPFAVYMGDNYCATDYVFEGRDMDYYRTELLRRFGPGKTSILDLLQQTDVGWKSEGYYVDDFGNLLNGASN
ncbi:hypothetical protein [Paenibacillus methanolicus]|uniref:Uncharacterized protein n=1 Tax=Paenibacillus methanolicus TaxID=582686 RepID=A0A5S5C8J2_9BACL|nr:hypothetical protein [Paenibacillus methanolicus]TYP74650.1 hypothetical protein BCM02_105194 [Paenibacillus methanolicus]